MNWVGGLKKRRPCRYIHVCAIFMRNAFTPCIHSSTWTHVRRTLHFCFWYVYSLQISVKNELSHEVQAHLECKKMLRQHQERLEATEKERDQLNHSLMERQALVEQEQQHITGLQVRGLLIQYALKFTSPIIIEYIIAICFLCSCRYHWPNSS